MVSLRRQKLKAKRAGCDPEKVDKCLNHDEVMKLMYNLNEKPKKK